VNQVIAEEVHDSGKKFAGRKAQPSDQIRFKVEYGGATDHGNIYLRDCGDEVTSQLAKVMTGLAFCVSNASLLEEVGHRWDLFVCHLDDTRTW
jgi:hypothetical protein